MLSLALILACRPPYATATFHLTLTNTSSSGALTASDQTTFDADFAPGIAIVGGPTFHLVEEGATASVNGVEALGEDGDPTKLAATLDTLDTVEKHGFLEYLDADTYAAAPMGPGDSAKLALTLGDWQSVTIAFMFGQSNDTIIAGLDLSLFDDSGAPVYGDLTSQLRYYDVGTEVNQEPGIGPDQAPRQTAPDTGASENNPVLAFDTTDGSGFAYPAIPTILTLTADAPN